MLSIFNPRKVNRKIPSIWRDNSVLQQCTVNSWDVFTPVPVLRVPMQAMAILYRFDTEKNGNINNFPLHDILLGRKCRICCSPHSKFK